MPVEHHSGLPAWLPPHQVAILSISQDQSDHAWELAGKARALGLGVRVIEDGLLPGRVHQASLDKYEHIVVLDDLLPGLNAGVSDGPGN